MPRNPQLPPMMAESWAAREMPFRTSLDLHGGLRSGSVCPSSLYACVRHNSWLRHLLPRWQLSSHPYSVSLLGICNCGCVFILTRLMLRPAWRGDLSASSSTPPPPALRPPAVSKYESPLEGWGWFSRGGGRDLNVFWVLNRCGHRKSQPCCVPPHFSNQGIQQTHKKPD